VGKVYTCTPTKTKFGTTITIKISAFVAVQHQVCDEECYVTKPAIEHQ